MFPSRPDLSAARLTPYLSCNGIRSLIDPDNLRLRDHSVLYPTHINKGYT